MHAQPLNGLPRITPHQILSQAQSAKLLRELALHAAQSRYFS